MEIKHQQIRKQLQKKQKKLMYKIAVSLDEIQNGKYDKKIKEALKKQ